MTEAYLYAGRQVDVLAFDGATPSGEILLQQTFCQPDESGKITTGIQSLAQRVLLELLTETGTILYDQERGTPFMTEARLGYFRTQLDVYGAFSRAEDLIAKAMADDETLDMPADERYEKMEIVSLVLAPGSVKLYVRLWSKAGKDRAVILPVSWTV